MYCELIYIVYYNSIYVKLQKQLGRFSGGIQLYLYGLLYKNIPLKVTKMMRTRS
jgi:hypothetical protein